MSAEVLQPIGDNSGLTPPLDLIVDVDSGYAWADPEAKPPKVAYSSNPGFTKGTAAEDYPVTAETSMFAIVGPDNGFVSSGAVVEGLESAYVLSLHPAEAKARRLEEPIDDGLAFTGLQWLKQQALGRKDSQLRRNINRAYARFKGQQEVQATRAETGESYANASRLVAEHGPEIAVSGIQSELAQQKAKQAAYRSRFETSVAATIEGFVPKGTSEPLDPSSFLLLSKDLVVSQADDGSLATNEGNKSYQTGITKRAQQYMRDPAVMVNDLIVARLVDEKAGGEAAPDDLSTAYTNRIMCDVLDAALKGFYTPAELSPELISGWMDIAYRLDGDMTVEELDAASKTDVNEWALIMVMSTGREVLSTTMHKIAAEQPKKFIDGLYMIAEAGLDDPAHRTKTFTGVRIIEEVMDPKLQPLSEHILSTATGALDDVELRQKALDLQVSLYDLGVPGSMLGISAFSGPAEHTVTMTTLTRAQAKIIRRLTPSAMVRPKGMDQQEFQAKLISTYRDHLQAFWDYVRTPEGGANTLTGRLLSHKRKTSPLILKARPEDQLPTLIRALEP